MRKLQTYITKEGFEGLIDQIAKLDTEINEIETEMERTLLNYSYQDDFYKELAAKKKKRVIKRYDLTKLLDSCEVIEFSTLKSKDEVSLGCKVHIVNHRFAYTVTIVDSIEANPSKGYVSEDSPIGSSVIGHKLGETIMVPTPSGEIEFVIKSIE